MYDKDAAAHTYDQAGAACVVKSSALILGEWILIKNPEELCSRWDMNYDMKHSFDNHQQNETK